MSNNQHIPLYVPPEVLEIYHSFATVVVDGITYKLYNETDWDQVQGENKISLSNMNIARYMGYLDQTPEIPALDQLATILEPKLGQVYKILVDTHDEIYIYLDNWFMIGTTTLGDTVKTLVDEALPESVKVMPDELGLPNSILVMNEEGTAVIWSLPITDYLEAILADMDVLTRSSLETILLEKNYVTTDNVASVVDAIVLAKELVNATQVNEIINEKNYLDETAVNELITDKDYTTSSEVDQKIADATTDFMTSTEVDTAITDKGYATSDEVTGAINTATANFVSESDVETLIESKDFITGTELNEATASLVTSTQVNSAITNALNGKFKISTEAPTDTTPGTNEEVMFVIGAGVYVYMDGWKLCGI